MTNPAIAALFNEIADFLEIKGDNPFRVRAYRRAAETAEGLAEDLAAVAARGGLLEIPGIGKDLAAKIQEYLDHGTVEYLEGLRREIPPGVVELMRIHGVGPKTAKLLYERAGVDSVEKLEALAQAHKLVGIPGIQAKTEENILKGIAVWKSGQERMPLGAALPLAEAIVASLRAHGAVERIALAGSLRRMKETVKDIDVLVTSKTPARVMEVFLGLPNVADVLVHGDTKSSVRLREKIQVDLRVVEPACFGAALQYFTGSKQHNIRVRELAQRRGLKVNEYGVFDETGGSPRGRRHGGGGLSRRRSPVHPAGDPGGRRGDRGRAGRPAADAGHAGRDPGRPAATHDVERRGPFAGGACSRRPVQGLSVHGGHRPLQVVHGRRRHGRGAGGRG